MPDARILRSIADPVSGGSRHTFDHELARADGTLFCFDFADSRSQNQVSLGPITPGSIFKDLGDPGSPDMLAAGATNAASNTGTALQMATATSGGAQALTIGAAGLYNRNFDFHLHAVLTVPDDVGNSGYTSAGVLRFGTAANDCLFNLDLGANGRSPSARVKSIAGSTVALGFAGFALGAPQIIDVVASGTSGYLFLNGVQVANTSIAGISNLAAAQMTVFGGRGGAKLHRVMLEDLGRVTAYEAMLGRSFTYADAVADAYAASVAHTYP